MRAEEFTKANFLFPVSLSINRKLTMQIVPSSKEVFLSELNTLNIGVEFLRIHSVITRGLEVATENSQSFAQQGYPNTSMREGFISYLRSLVSVLHAHHLNEDEVAFPNLRDKFPDTPWDLLKAQHRDIVSVLEEIKAAIEEAAADAQASESLNKLNHALRRITDLWHPHIRIEEDHFTVDKVALLIDLKEQIRLSRMFMEHFQKNSGPDYLVVPFLLYNLPPEERVTFTERMPPLVTEQLVPAVWKEKWEPMKPFLLS
jgi:iron-sulfur cluster repair protein YtfE (RIC family)